MADGLVVIHHHPCEHWYAYRRTDEGLVGVGLCTPGWNYLCSEEPCEACEDSYERHAIDAGTASPS